MVLRRLCKLTAACIACIASLATASAAGPERADPAADMVALTVCVISADIRVAAVTQMQNGTDRDQVLRAVQDTLADRVYRSHAERIVNEVYRARPTQLRLYVSERLQRCVADAARGADARVADACYELTRLARDVMAARDGGASLTDTSNAVAALAHERGLSADGARRLGDVAARAYAAGEPPSQFRAGLFYHCVMPPRAG
jgi:hypothetical protein